MDDIESRVPIIAKRPRTKTVIIVPNKPKIKDESNPRTQKKPDDKSCIDDTRLSEQGKNRINKAKDGLPGLLIVKEVNKNTLPLKGSHICCCTNINPHIGVLIQTLCELGADVSWCSSNINTVEDDVCAAVADFGVSVHAWYGQTEDDYWWCIDECINSACNKPDFIIDDGGDLTSVMLTKFPKLFHNLKGIVETSEYGVYKLYSLAKSQQLLIPAMNITNSISLQHFWRIFYFRECLIKCLDLAQESLISGKKFLICGYGHRGKGCAKNLRLFGATVYVTEIDPICALQACSDGIEVVEMDSVLGLVDVIVLCTENKNIIGKEEIEKIKNNCLIINYGHSPCEIDMEGIKKGEVIVDDSNQNVTRLIFPSHKIIRILFNGDPVQSISFQIPETILSIKTSTIIVAILELNMFSRNRYDGGVYLLPKKLDEYIALIHLKIFSASITKITDDQMEFLGIPKEGPFKSQHYRY